MRNSCSASNRSASVAAVTMCKSSSSGITFVVLANWFVLLPTERPRYVCTVDRATMTTACHGSSFLALRSGTATLDCCLATDGGRRSISGGISVDNGWGRASSSRTRSSMLASLVEQADSAAYTVQRLESPTLKASGSGLQEVPAIVVQLRQTDVTPPVRRPIGHRPQRLVSHCPPRFRPADPSPVGLHAA